MLTAVVSYSFDRDSLYNETLGQVIYDTNEIVRNGLHPSSSYSSEPYWFGLLSSIATALVAAIIRLLEKRIRDKDKESHS